MKPSTELFELIKSMTTQEKRYFKLAASLQRGDKKYIQLFDLLDKQVDYNESLLKDKFCDVEKKNGFAHTKNYLYKIICRSLIQFRNDLSVDSRLNNLYERCKILQEKALFSQYFKAVRAGKELAQRHERFGYLIEFLEIERKLVKKEDTVSKSTDRFYKEELLILEKIRNLNEYKRAVSEILEVYRDTGVVRTPDEMNRLENLISQVDFVDVSQVKSITATERFYYAMYLFNSISGRLKTACTYAEKRYLMIKEHREIIEDSLSEASRESLYELIKANIRTDNLKSARHYLNLCKKQFDRSELNLLNVKLLEFFLEISEYQTKKLPHYKHVTEQALQFLTNMKGKITITTLNEMIYRLAYLEFVNKDYSAAVKLTDSMLNTKNMKLTPQIEPYVRMLLVLSHYELGSYKLLQFLIPSTAKLLKKKRKLYEPEAQVLKHLKKAISLKRDELVAEQLQLLADDIAKSSSQEFAANASVYLDYHDWVLSKIRELNVTANICLR